MALICGRNRGVLITEFKKETDRGLLFGLNGRVALIERILLEGFYCIFFLNNLYKKGTYQLIVEASKTENINLCYSFLENHNIGINECYLKWPTEQCRSKDVVIVPLKSPIHQPLCFIARQRYHLLSAVVPMVSVGLSQPVIRV